MNQLLPIYEKLNIPGEHPFFFTGPAGQIEAVLTVPPKLDVRYIAILGHPHSLQGGTMNNKVVTTMARAFKELNMASIRFNFRGVGQSTGTYDAGMGESEDMLFLARLWKEIEADVQFIFAGFSFGSYVAYRAAAQCNHALLITIAPSVHHYNYLAFSPAPTPWIMVQGDEDEIVPLQYVLDFVAEAPLAIPLIRFADTGHFFHGKLIDLKLRLIEVIRDHVEMT